MNQAIPPTFMLPEPKFLNLHGSRRVLFISHSSLVPHRLRMATITSSSFQDPHWRRCFHPGQVFLCQRKKNNARPMSCHLKLPCSSELCWSQSNFTGISHMAESQNQTCGEIFFWYRAAANNTEQQCSSRDSPILPSSQTFLFLSLPWMKHTLLFCKKGTPRSTLIQS